MIFPAGPVGELEYHGPTVIFWWYSIHQFLYIGSLLGVKVELVSLMQLFWWECERMLTQNPGRALIVWLGMCHFAVLGLEKFESLDLFEQYSIWNILYNYMYVLFDYIWYVYIHIYIKTKTCKQYNTFKYDIHIVSHSIAAVRPLHWPWLDLILEFGCSWSSFQNKTQITM